MVLSVETLIGFVSVSLFWGVTNPLMKKGAQGMDQKKSSSTINQIFNDTYFLFTNLKYLIPFSFNQIGSLLYVALLQQTDLSLAVVVVNSLTFAVTALTGRFVGEEKVHKMTYAGVLLVLLGTTLCCIGKAESTLA